LSNKVVVTVLGKDRTGIVAGVSNALADLGINIEDLTSAKMKDMFVMLMLADITDAKKGIREIQKEMEQCGNRIGVQVIVQHEDIFNYMHRV